MITRWDLGDDVRVIRNVRNDGTYCGAATGDLLVRRGSVGAVVDIGTFLQDQVIYQVHFFEQDYTVGCREQELISADDPWIDSEFEFGDWVEANAALAIKGEVIAPVGKRGQVMSVRRDLNPIRYEVLFDDRMLQVPLSAIRWPEMIQKLEAVQKKEEVAL